MIQIHSIHKSLRSLHYSQQCFSLLKKAADSNISSRTVVLINNKQGKRASDSFHHYFSTSSSSSNSNSDGNGNGNGNGKESRQSKEKGTDESKPQPPSQQRKEEESVIFPWRENATVPLARIGARDDLSGYIHRKPYYWYTCYQRMICAVELKEFALFSFFISKQWENDLATNASGAFQTAVSGLVSRTFSIPLHRIENTLEDGLIIDSVANVNGKVTDDGSMDGNVNNEHDIEDATEFIQNMIESNLLSLYKPLRQNACKDKHKNDTEKDSNNNQRRQYQITFCLKPISSRLENIFIIPFFSRQDVEHNPTLKGAYTAIEDAYWQKKSFDKIGDILMESVKKTSHNGTKRSIIMDISIDCAEIFQIKDLSNGKIIQGQGKNVEENGNGSSRDENDFSDLDLEPAKTTHLVRFEMVTSKGQLPGERKIGSWYIIDIDDMLDGNKWH